MVVDVKHWEMTFDELKALGRAFDMGSYKDAGSASQVFKDIFPQGIQTDLCQKITLF